MRLLAFFVISLSCQASLSPLASTEPVDVDADDPAIWIHPTDPAKSLVVGTDKGGGLYVFDLDGKTVQAVRGLNYLNNVDIEYGLAFPDGKKDIAGATERGARALRVFSIVDGRLQDVTGKTEMFAGQSGESGAPMGIALYKHKDGAVHAFVSRKESPKAGAIWQYRLQSNADGRIDAVKVREIGTSSGDEIEALAVDDELGYLYCSEEKVGIHKYDIATGKRLAVFGAGRFMGDREGIGIYTTPGGKGYIVVSDQGEGPSELHFYRREGEPGAQHDHTKLLLELPSGADTTDGLEVVSRSLGKYDHGMLAAMNSKGRNFLLYRWTDIEAKLGNAGR